MRFTCARCAGWAAVMLLVAGAAPAGAQTPAADPEPKVVTVTGSMDVLNTYMFRGIRQDDTRAIFWPAVDLGLTAYSGDGGLKSVSFNVGSWNSLHTGDMGKRGPTGKLWYEDDFYATAGLGFAGGVSLGTTFTAYRSPNDSFSTVKEIAFNLGVDDSAALGRGALHPYVITAFEFDTQPGLGQADGGEKAGTYLELGVKPGVTAPHFSVAFPVKTGLSARNYYELDGVDHKFGYFSAAGIVTVPMGSTTYGAWNVHGGVEFQALGDTTKAINGGKDTKVIALAGIGFSY